MNREAIIEYVRDVQGADRHDDQAFRRLFAAGMNLLQLLDIDVAREFGVSRPSVNRWRNGINAPHPAMRKPVYTWLEQRANALLRRSNMPAAVQSSSTATAPTTMAARGR